MFFCALCNVYMCAARWLQGMVLVSPALKPVACQRFEANVYVLFHTNYLCRGFQTVVHVGNVMQTAIIVHMNKVSTDIQYDTIRYNILGY